MNLNEYFSLGELSKTYSFKGELHARIDVDVPHLWDNITALFVELDDNLVPYLIERVEPQKNNFVRIKFKGIDTEETAKKLVKKQLYLPDELLPKLKPDEFYFHDIIGFTAFDKQEKLGAIKQVYDLPANPMAEVSVNNKEVLIPLNLMTSWSKKDQTMVFDLPDGLLEL